MGLDLDFVTLSDFMFFIYVKIVYSNKIFECFNFRNDYSFCTVDSHLNTSRVISGDTVWCDSGYNIWSNIRSTGADWNTSDSICNNLSYAGYSTGSWGLPEGHDDFLDCYNASTCVNSSGYYIEFWSSEVFGMQGQYRCVYSFSDGDYGGVGQGCFGMSLSYHVRCMVK